MAAQDKSLTELDELEALVRKLAEKVETLSLGMRYRRADSKGNFSTVVRRSQDYVKLALGMLETRSSEAHDSVDTDWLRERLGQLSKRLARGAFGDGPLLAIEPTPSADKRVGTASFQGDTSSIGISEVLRMLQMQAQTGTLRVRLADELVTVEFVRGDIVHAFSSNTPPGQRLGEILVRQGVLTSRQLVNVLHSANGDKGRLGDALRNQGLAREEDLRTALDEQMQELFHRLIASSRADYAFHEGEVSAAPDRARVNLMQLLLESPRLVDEAGN